MNNAKARLETSARGAFEATHGSMRKGAVERDQRMIAETEVEANTRQENIGAEAC